jgi:copper chaperone CopZ
MRRVAAALLMLFGSISVAAAGECKVEGVHICCGGCVKGIEAALKDAEGVTGLKVDKDNGTVTFTTETRKLSNQALGKLRKAGYYGKAAFDGKEFKEPESKIEEGAKADAVAISGLHLCCGACVDSVKEALKEVEGVKEVTTEQKEGKASIAGTGVKLQAVYDALHKAGFHGAVK